MSSSTAPMRTRLRKLISEAVDSKLRQSAETEHQKEIRARAKDELGVPTKLFNQTVKVAFEHSANDYSEERDAVLEMAEIAGVYDPNEG